jgi:hypothetical protein
MTTHYHSYDAADGGSYSSCGLYSPPVRCVGAWHMVYPLPQTTEVTKVTCKRCLKSEEYRKANAITSGNHKSET